MHPYRRAALLMPHGSGRARERRAGHLPERETVLPCRRMAAGDEASPGLRPLRSGVARGRTFPFMSGFVLSARKAFLALLSVLCRRRQRPGRLLHGSCRSSKIYREAAQRGRVLFKNSGAARVYADYSGASATDFHRFPFLITILR